MDISLNLYKNFWIVSQCNSYTEASKKLQVTPATVSANIISLEEKLNVKLFDRNKDGVALTDKGKQLFEVIEEGMESLDFAEKMMLDKTELSNGQIDIGAPSDIIKFCLLDVIDKVCMDYPELFIQVRSNASTDELIKLLEDHKVDFLVIGEIPQKYKKNSKFIIRPFKKVDYIFISNTPLKITNKEDFEKYKYILSSPNSKTSKTLAKYLERNKIKIKRRLVCDISEARINSVKKGVGIGYTMKDTVKEELKNGELYEVEVPIELPKIDINVIHIKGRLTQADRTFINKYLQA